MPIVCEETALQETKNIVHGLSNDLCKRLPQLSYEDVRGEAALNALAAIRKYDPCLGTQLSTWVYRFVQARLSSSSRSRLWQERNSNSIHQPLDSPPLARQSFDLSQFLWQLSEDAREAVKIALHLETRASLIARLRSNGWHAKRINRVFREVREALSCP